jgi:hypothetical protein
VVLAEHLFECLLMTPKLLDQVLDSLPGTLFYIKDVQGRYLWANETLVERSGVSATPGSRSCGAR